MAQIVGIDSNGHLAATNTTDSGSSDGSGGGDTSTANQEQIAVLEEVRDRLPPPGYFAPSNLIPDFLFVMEAGTIPAETNSVAIENIGASDGLLLGKVFPARAVISWSANGRDKLGEINYDASGTTFVITILSYAD